MDYFSQDVNCMYDISIYKEWNMKMYNPILLSMLVLL